MSEHIVSNLAIVLPHFESPETVIETVAVARKSDAISEILIVDDCSSERNWGELKRGIEDISSSWTDAPAVKFADSTSSESFLGAVRLTRSRTMTVRLARFEENVGPFVNKARGIHMCQASRALLLDADNAISLDQIRRLSLSPAVPRTIVMPFAHTRFPPVVTPALKIFPTVFLAPRVISIGLPEVRYLLKYAGKNVSRNLHYYLNTGNFLCDVNFYKSLPIPSEIDPGSSDVITLVRLWLEAGGDIRSKLFFHYKHRLSPNSHWSRLGNDEEVQEAVTSFFPTKRRLASAESAQKDNAMELPFVC